MTLREPRPEQFGLLLVGKIHLDHRVGGSIVGVAEHGKIKPVMVEPFAHRAEHVGEISRTNPDVYGMHRTPRAVPFGGSLSWLSVAGRQSRSGDTLR